MARTLVNAIALMSFALNIISSRSLLGYCAVGVSTSGEAGCMGCIGAANDTHVIDVGAVLVAVLL